jgi:hypothetical protein
VGSCTLRERVAADPMNEPGGTRPFPRPKRERANSRLSTIGIAVVTNGSNSDAWARRSTMTVPPPVSRTTRRCDSPATTGGLGHSCWDGVPGASGQVPAQPPSSLTSTWRPSRPPTDTAAGHGVAKLGWAERDWASWRRLLAAKP